MRRLIAAAAAVVLFCVMAGISLAAAPPMTWDATGIKGAKYVAISCFTYDGPWSTWRSDALPLAGSWEYRSSGSPGLYPDYAGETQCTVRAFDKRGKVVGYPAPVTWRFLP